MTQRKPSRLSQAVRHAACPTPASPSSTTPQAPEVMQCYRASRHLRPSRLSHRYTDQDPVITSGKFSFT
ncbi:hypothetical protein E2C01_031878 [Portunus trituberculatus]|uniref:Uncharacterized protein n=1 Tax=Portunus trituberculatus TaxID=210409 RepID=A0A5B7EVX9_PORTR|nr:hypothetical protein [Portunus trituberculatus]